MRRRAAAAASSMRVRRAFAPRARRVLHASSRALAPPPPRVIKVEGVELGRQWARDEATAAATKAALEAEEAALLREEAEAEAERRGGDSAPPGADHEPVGGEFTLRDAFHARLVPGQVWRYRVRDPLYDRHSALVVARVEEADALPDTVVHVVITGAHVRDPAGGIVRDCSWHVPMYARAVSDSVTTNVGTVTEEELRLADFAFSYSVWRERFDACAPADKAGEVVDMPAAEVVGRFEAKMAEAAADPELAAAMERDSPGVPVGAAPRPPGEALRVETLKRKYRGKATTPPVPEGFPEHLLPYVPGYRPPTDELHDRLVERRARERVMPDFTEIP